KKLSKPSKPGASNPARKTATPSPSKWPSKSTSTSTEILYASPASLRSAQDSITISISNESATVENASAAVEERRFSAASSPQIEAGFSPWGRIFFSLNSQQFHSFRPATLAPRHHIPSQHRKI